MGHLSHPVFFLRLIQRSPMIGLCPEDSMLESACMLAAEALLTGAAAAAAAGAASLSCIMTSVHSCRREGYHSY